MNAPYRIHPLYRKNKRIIKNNDGTYSIIRVRDWFQLNNVRFRATEKLNREYEIQEHKAFFDCIEPIQEFIKVEAGDIFVKELAPIPTPSINKERLLVFALSLIPLSFIVIAWYYLITCVFI